jgi:hypothetical protein
MSKIKLFLMLAVMATMAVPSAFASQPYMGAYFDQSYSTTTRAIFDCNFVGVSGSQLREQLAGGVLSVAGGSGSTPTGYIYQNGFALHSNNNVEWAPQYYSSVLIRMLRGDDLFEGRSHRSSLVLGITG